MICYFDTSALVKIYHQEAGSETVKALYHSTTDQIVISNLAIPETFSTFQRKRRDGLISKKDMRVENLFQQRAGDLVMGLFTTPFCALAKTLLGDHNGWFIC